MNTSGLRGTEIAVTKEDIYEGIRFSSSSCPIAIAASRVLGRPVDVTMVSIWEYGKNDRICNLSLAAADFVDRFDHGEPVEPFSFDVFLPKVTHGA